MSDETDENQLELLNDLPKKNPAYHQSTRHDWETPSKLFNSLNEEFFFDIDLAANYQNKKLPKHFGPGSSVVDSLSVSWKGFRGWLNPPYGREVYHFVKKAYEETNDPGTLVVMLIAARTDTKFWHEFVEKAEAVRFIKGRVVFEIDGKPILDKHGRPTGAPFPSAIVIFDGLVRAARRERGEKILRDAGYYSVPTFKGIIGEIGGVDIIHTADPEVSSD